LTTPEEFMDIEEGQNARTITLGWFYIVPRATSYENHPK
jgi:hypothetical protein